MKKVLVVQVAALGEQLLREAGITSLAGLPIQSLTPVSPAVTCVAQATLRTGLSPQAHGLSANGVFLRDVMESRFWCQSSALVKGARIWETFRARGGRVGLYFFQQSLGESADEIVSPAPIHKHGGGMVMATYQKPTRVLGMENPLQLHRYWGPLASPKVGRDIVRALGQRLVRGDAPDCMFVYLPTLDYDLQRYGTHHATTRASLREVLQQLDDLAGIARAQGYHLAVCGDYAITDVTGTVAFPNQHLHNLGFFKTRAVKGRLYPDFYQSRAFVLCDHQVAHVYCFDPRAKAAVREALRQLPEVETVQDGHGAIDFELVAKPGCWFAYPWWTTAREAPDYATHVDIHNKPGFDPCELFFGRTPFTSSTDVTRIRGTHGRGDALVAFATDLPMRPTSAIEFATELQAWLEEV